MLLLLTASGSVPLTLLLCRLAQPPTEDAVVQALSRSELATAAGAAGSVPPRAWPSILPLRTLAESLSPEQFIWAWFVLAGAASHVMAAEEEADGEASRPLLGRGLPEVAALMWQERDGDGDRQDRLG